MKSTVLLNPLAKLASGVFLFSLLISSPLLGHSAVKHLMITEIQITGENSSQDYLKIYNPTPKIINVGGYQLRKRTCQGKEYSLKVFPKGTIILPKKSLTWANAQDNFAQLIQANFSSRATLSANNSVALFNKKGEILDSVAWGQPKRYFGFGKPFSVNPQAHQVLKRKQNGNCFLDSDNNALDFYLASDLTSSPITDNLNSEQSASRLSSQGLRLGLGGGFGLLGLILVLILERKKSS